MSVSIEVNGWEANLRFSAAHFIPGLGKCSRLHGHDYAVSLRIEGETRESILMDFIPLKAAVREALEEVDHRILIPTRCPQGRCQERGHEHKGAVGGGEEHDRAFIRCCPL
ncbi:6-carboxytetrahydropterin synthase [Thermogymnomonas acidicola]|uniref:6-pyruvoyl trahydropterin synthase family protein n=1 Tax=Thermogymnomonas acidicola TaxID=399579 RepID=UPI000946795B|nr:6-carboxytetrahydropterin synthase [Thermogymnomonas acidicola]